MDVDGTLTDGKIYMGTSGELIKAFDIKDGFILARLSDYNITPIIITGRKSDILLNRCKELNIKEIHQGISDKIDCLKKIIGKYNYTLTETAYIGDDLNDKDCMNLCGFSGCPSDAITAIKDCVNYICKNKGGNGAVREFIDLIIKNNGN